MDFELRRQARMAMRGVPERLGLSFAQGNIEMRGKPNGAGGTSYEYNGYATVYNAPFQMWDQNGDPFTEIVAPGACKRSLMNPALDVPFLIGHNSAGIPLARTKSGTMRLSEDSTGLHVNVPAMDGRREEVRALFSAVDRKDMDEMSLAFVCTTPADQQWDAAYETRTVHDMDLHRGDVCAVTHGANPATAGAWMSAVEQLAFRRPAAIGGPVLLERRAAMSTAEQHGHPGQQCWDPDGDGDCDLTAAGDTDHDYWSADGQQLKPVPGKPMERSEARLLELLSSVPQAERDKAKAEGNSLPDGSYPVNNAHQLHAAAVLAASHHGDWQAAQALIRRRAKELGVDVTTLPGFGEEKSSGRPLELRATAADDVKSATAPDYDPNAAAHDDCMTCGGSGQLPHPSLGGAGITCPGCSGTGAVVTVDDSTGIPGPEQQMAARRLRALELEEIARRPA